MKKFYSVALTFALCLVFVFCGFSSVGAQENDAYEFTLEEITVTAEKREENVQKTAISITAVAGTEIQEKAYSTLDSILKDIAAVQVQGYKRGGQVFIRGIGTNVDANTTDPSVAVMTDGVYNHRPEKSLSYMYDMERLEVLRGPQGTMYGRNAIGGVVNLVTRSPSDQVEILGNLQIGDFNLKHYDGALNIPISEKISTRLAFLRETRDGYISNGGNNADMFSFRGKLLYKPTEKLSFLTIVEYNHDKSSGSSLVPVPGSAGNLPDMDWVDSSIAEEGWVVPEGSDVWTNDEYHPAGSQDSIYKTYTIQTDLDLGWSLLTVAPSYVKNDRLFRSNLMDGIATGNEYNSNIGIDKQFFGEARMTSPATSSIKWIIGYYWLDSKFSQGLTTDTGLSTSREGWNSATYKRPMNTNAFFGQLTYPLSEKFRMTGGIRHSVDDRSLDYIYYYVEDSQVTWDSGRLHYDEAIKSTTYKAGIEYDLSEDSMLYTQVSTGFKAGGLNLTIPPTRFEPEELVAYEIGSKNRFLSNLLQVNLELYYYDYNNFQVEASGSTATIAATGATMSYMAILNADKGTIKGGEMELEYLISQNDTVKASLAYMDAVYGDVSLPANSMAGTTEPYFLGGTRMSNSPEWVSTLGYERSWILPEGASIKANFNTRFSSGYYTTVEKYLAGSWQDSYHRSDANVNYYTADGKWTVGVWCKNIENHAQTTWTMPMYRRMITNPRTTGITISFRY